MVRAGLMEEHEATGSQGNTFKELTATPRGRDAAHRAALDERARIEAEGGRVVRVRLDAELKSIVATATETAKAAAA